MMLSPFISCELSSDTVTLLSEWVTYNYVLQMVTFEQEERNCSYSNAKIQSLILEEVNLFFYRSYGMVLKYFEQ